MDRELRIRRDQAAARHDAALARDGARATAWFTAELEGVVAQLQAVAGAADRRDADAVEVAKTYRWLGDALFDLGRGCDRTLLGRGRQAYERAEALLAAQLAPVEQAKTALSHANTLRGLSEGSDVPLLEAVEARYEAALAAFRANHLPQLASAVQAYLPSLRAQLRLACEAELARQAAAPRDRPAPDTARESFGESTESVMLAMLGARVEREIAQGRVAPERVALLRDAVARVQAVFATGGGDDAEALQKRSQALREVMRLTADLAARPSWRAQDPLPGTRAERAVAILQGLRARMLAEKLVGMLPAGESEVGTDLLARVATLEARIRDLSDDEQAVAAVDGYVWRLAADVQAYACRYNLQLAQPVFRTRRELGVPRSVFVSGGEALAAAADRLQSLGEIVIHGEARPGDYAEQRWNQLLSATVGVFDLGVPAGTARAQVCYELGLALALGKPSVITIREAQPLPFDVDPTPHVLRERAETDSATLLDAIGRALAAPGWGGSEGGLGDRPARALAWLEQRTGGRLAEGALGVGFRLAQAARGDAVGFRRSLDQLLGMLGADAPLALVPSWPAAYPDPARPPRCFHVMPFQPEWANPTREIARAACVARGWSYRRGDEAEEQRIVRAIWTEIASARAVLVDITGCNPNVALELGLAHALGRPAWIVAQGDSEPYRFPSVSKVQVHRYEAGAGYAGFEACVLGLLESAGGSFPQGKPRPSTGKGVIVDLVPRRPEGERRPEP